MLSLRKLFKFPGPSAFREGVNDFALQSRDFSPEVSADVYCWEDYYADLKKAYPIRYFFAETLADFLRFKVWAPIVKPFKDFKYWFVSHVVPSRRYHMLDLRQPNGYRYGWQDTDRRMLYANFNLLNEFVKHEMEDFYCPTPDECSDEGSRIQRNTYFEIHEIHNWWNVERQKELNAIDKLTNDWWKAKKAIDPRASELFDELQSLKQKYDEKEEEMLIRLIKVRKSLWT